MAIDERDVLDVLKSELDFIRKGNYSAPARNPCLPASIFQDSSTCLKVTDPNGNHTCDECLLTALVPRDRLCEAVPCHHIPLNPEGETIHYLEHNETHQVMETKVNAWLGRMVKILEDVRGQ